MAAPEHLRARLRGCSLATQLARIEQLVGPATANAEHRVTVLTLQSIVARIRFLSQQVNELNPELMTLIKQHPAGPTLLAEPGVGPVVAAQLLVSWSHRGRVRNEAAFAALAGAAPLEASSGQRTRHRLNRGGIATSTGPCTPSRSLACDATPRPATTRPSAPPRARHTATSGAPSNAPSPDGSTDASKPRHVPKSRRSELDKHRSVQRAAATVLPDLYGLSGVVVGSAARSVPQDTGQADSSTSCRPAG